MGKNRPTVVNTQDHHIRGIWNWTDYIVRWFTFSAILSFISMVIWNYSIANTFNLEQVGFHSAFAIWTLIALTRVAFYSFRYLAFKP